MTMKLIQGDCLELMKRIPDSSVDLVLTDPPYNVSVTTYKNGKIKKNEWDSIENYIDWCIAWLTQCQRVLKPNGVLYFWHNDIQQIADLLLAIRQHTNFLFRSFCIWDKGKSYRAKVWLNRKPDSVSALRSWFNVCEYCLHFFKTPETKKNAGTGLDRIKNEPECYKPLKDWYVAEKKRLGVTEKMILERYRKEIGKSGAMLRHYFKNTQFEIPTEEVWNRVFVPLGFGKSHENLYKDYEELTESYGTLRKSYELLRKNYEKLRYVHHCDEQHCNVWHVPSVPFNKRFHTCQKPVEILERLIRVSSNEDGVVLDCFMGSGSTGVACLNTGRNFIGIEKDETYFKIAEERIHKAKIKIQSC